MESGLTGTVVDVGEVIVVSPEVMITVDVTTLDSADEGDGEEVLSPGVLVGSTVVGEDEGEGDEGEGEVEELRAGEVLSGVEEDD